MATLFRFQVQLLAEGQRLQEAMRKLDADDGDIIGALKQIGKCTGLSLQAHASQLSSQQNTEQRLKR